MSAAIVARLGLDQSDFKNGLRSAVAEKNRAVKDMTARVGRSQAGDFRLGQVAMQAQDVAVSLEMGASMSRVIAQQGSQIASIFGSSGMIVGGGLAIGGVLVSMASEAQNAFHASLKAFQVFDAGIRQTIKTGGISELDAAFTSLPNKVQELQGQLAGLKGLSGLMSNFGALFGGPTTNQQHHKIFANILATEQAMAQTAERRVVLEEELTAIAKARAQGNVQEAEDLERLIKLREALNQIEKQGYDETTVKKLKAEKEAQFAADGIVIAKERQAKMEEECAKHAEDHAKAIEKQHENERALADLQEAKRKRAADMRDERVAAEQELARVGETAAEKQARLLKEYAALQGAAHAAEMLQMPEADKLREEAAKKQKELAEDAIAQNKDIAKAEEARGEKAEELHGKLHELEAKRVEQQKESVKLTLGELATEGRGPDAIAARKAVKELERSRKASLRGDLEGAERHRDNAEKIKKNINSLKDSEKGIGDEFADALEASNILKQIEKNTAGAGQMKP